MENNNLRPMSLGAVAGRESLGVDIRSRATMLRGLTSPDAQMNNTDNFRVLPIDALQEFKNHPFVVRDDEEMEALAESIRESGLLQPIIVREATDGKYEILAGHRRVMASRKLGKEEISARVLNVNDEEAIFIMTDTNLKQRIKLAHSERAKAYKMQMDAYRCQGKRNDLVRAVDEGWDFDSIGTKDKSDLGSSGTKDKSDLGSGGTKVFYQLQQDILMGETNVLKRPDWNDEDGKPMKSRDIVAAMYHTSNGQVTRYVRLNNLVSTLLEKVDSEEIAFQAGVNLSFLSKGEQGLIVDAMEQDIIKKIDLKLSAELKDLSQADQLNETVINHMFTKAEAVKPQNAYTVFQSATKQALKHFRKADYNDVEINPTELEQVIIEAIQNYAKRRG